MGDTCADHPETCTSYRLISNAGGPSERLDCSRRPVGLSGVRRLSKRVQAVRAGPSKRRDNECVYSSLGPLDGSDDDKQLADRRNIARRNHVS